MVVRIAACHRAAKQRTSVEMTADTNIRKTLAVLFVLDHPHELLANLHKGMINVNIESFFLRIRRGFEIENIYDFI